MTAPLSVRCAAVFALMLFPSAALLASAQSSGVAPATQKTPAKTTPAPPAQAATDDPGERAFQANCSRCHNAPEQLSRRITGTVIMHMRVRASLSAQDERDIIHFFAP
jgi:cytochrome c5